jgi:hypothetical protein
VEIKQLCGSSRCKKVKIAIYCKRHGVGWQQIKKCGKSTTTQFVCFGFGNSTDIICTPIQEFFLSSSQRWILAYQLKKGDLLFCKDGPRAITSIEFVEKSIDVYLFELQKIHTFFVGYYGALTHNMELPMEWGLGASMSCGIGTGGSAGSFFGPAFFALGCLAGALVGLCVELVRKDSIKKYSIEGIPLLFFDESGQNNDSSSTSSSSGGSLSPMPDGPKKDDEEDKKRIKISEKDRHHIFRDAEGHFPKDTPEVRRLIKGMVNDKSNYQGPDRFGNKIYSKKLPDGSQLWAKTRNNFIRWAGKNKIPWHYELGVDLIRPFFKN